VRQHGDESAPGAPLAARSARRGGIPLYYQIMRDLKEQIVSGRLCPGDQLPSEAELTRHFGVSRVVIRRALLILHEQGLIVKIKGKGTFVAPSAAEDATLWVNGSLEDLIHIGPDTTIRVVEFRMVKVTPDLTEVFAEKEGADIFYLKRVRSVGGQPLAVMVNHVPYVIGARISLDELTKTPLIVLIEQRANVSVEWASQVFQAVAADEEMATLLGVDSLTPLLKLTLTVYSTEGQVVDLASVYYRSDRYNHHGYLTRNRAGGSLFWDSWESNGETAPHVPTVVRAG